MEQREDEDWVEVILSYYLSFAFFVFFLPSWGFLDVRQKE